MIGVFGQVNLYDADMRAIRLALSSTANVEIDVALPGEFAQPSAEAHPIEYLVTFVCRNEVGHLSPEPQEEAASDK